MSVRSKRRRMVAMLSTLTVVACLQAAAQRGPLAQPQPVAPTEGLHAVLIGTGIPLPNPDRAAAATLIVAGGRTYLVDTGRNSVVRLAEAGYQDVDAILYTHYHSDHFAGLGEIMVGRGIAGADRPMRILGPKGAKKVVAGILEAYQLDTEYRKSHHKEHWHDDAMRADVAEHEPGVILEEHGLKITMFDVDHPPIVPAVGYRFDYQGQSVVVSGDTIKSSKLTERAKDCDILIHEAIDNRMYLAVKPAVAQANPRMGHMLDDLLEYHTPTLEVAEIARDANVKKLVLTHLIPSIPPNEAAENNFVRGMNEIYKGPIVVGRDGMLISP